MIQGCVVYTVSGSFASDHGRMSEYMNVDNIKPHFLFRLLLMHTRTMYYEKYVPFFYNILISNTFLFLTTSLANK